MRDVPQRGIKRHSAKANADSIQPAQMLRTGLFGGGRNGFASLAARYETAS
jgi:hypothetical protein